MVLASACVLGACVSSDDIGDQLEAAETLVTDFGLTQVTGPNEVVSKTIHYASASGLMGGDVELVVGSAEELLTSSGWSVALVEPLDVSGSPASEGARVVATKDDLVTRVAASDQVGVNPAPVGFTWVQISVAKSGDDLAWTIIG